jgi:hypothetical protein
MYLSYFMSSIQYTKVNFSFMYECAFVGPYMNNKYLSNI